MSTFNKPWISFHPIHQVESRRPNPAKYRARAQFLLKHFSYQFNIRTLEIIICIVEHSPELMNRTVSQNSKLRVLVIHDCILPPYEADIII
jgi:hypothetical protein